MNKLIAELQRLYFLPEHSLGAGDAPELKLAGAEGMVRAMVLTFERAVDWEYAAALYRSVQEDLELPAPAVSVSASEGYQIWFSLCEPVPVQRAGLFLDALRRTCLHELRPADLTFWPDVETSLASAPNGMTLPPAHHASNGKWSAFIDPGLGSMFIEEPGLGMSPTMDRQADLLAGLQSIKASAFERALDVVLGQADGVAVPAELAVVRPHESLGAVPPGQSMRNLDRHFADPRSFLLALMNDSSASTDHRIEAAKALLPYFFENDTKTPAPGSRQTPFSDSL